LLSTSASTVGSASITVSAAAGSSSGTTFYIQSLASTGSATITETAPGYNSTVATVDFTPSGFIVEGGTPTTTFSGTSPVEVYFAQLDPSTLAFTSELTLRPGASATVVLTETDTPSGVGSLGSSSLVFNAGDAMHSTTYQPTGTATGTSVIGFKSTLTGYSKPSNYDTTTFTVTAPAIYLQPASGV
jgi:hypothetical protein